MATTRPAGPQMNLKDRIAALQKSSSANHHGVEASTLGTGSLRDKIASFERKGSVPTPRGRFGSSTPQAAADGVSKKRGELYGNRVPELAKPSPEAVLAPRARTLSTSSLHASRPTTPSPETLAEPVPPIPASLGNVGRRIVSDVLPRRSETFDVRRNEDTEKTTAPAVVVSKVEAIPTDSGSSEPARGDAEPPRGYEENKTTDNTPPKIDTPPIATASRVESTHLDLSPAPVPAPLANIQLVVKTETDGSSSADETVASSDSVPTPSDNHSFMSPESPKDSMIKSPTFFSKESAVATAAIEDPPITSNPSARVVTKVTVVSRNTSRQSTEEKTDIPAAIVADAHNAKKIQTPPSVVTRAPVQTTTTVAAVTKTSTPAPAPAARSTAAAIVVPPPSPAPAPAPSVERKAQPTYNVVVHRKVREATQPEPAPAVPAPKVTVPKPVAAPAPTPVKVAAPVAPVVRPQSSTPKVTATRKPPTQDFLPLPEPSTSTFGDLASLMFSASLLEEQLAFDVPVKKPSTQSTPAPITPTVNVQTVASEKQESKKAEAAPSFRSAELSYDGPELAPVVEDEVLESTSLAAPAPSNTQKAPSVKTATRSEQPSPPRDSRQFGSIRSRMSAPSVQSRASICSEVSSEESTVLVSRPVSPPAMSDTSSIRSSSKSWKSPKKGFGRASSWLFRSKHKSSSGNTADDGNGTEVPPSPSLLSPYPSMNGGSRTPSRPGSWLSVGSSGSTDVFDSEIVNSFPSVPGAAQANSSSHLRSQTTPSSSASGQSSLSAARAQTLGPSSGRQRLY